MTNYNYWAEDSSEAIEHHGILGMKWGKRRYQYEDGSLTPEGRRRYLKGDGRLTRAGKKELKRRNEILKNEYGRRIRGAEAAYERNDEDAFDKFRGVQLATSLDDLRFKEFEQQYETAFNKTQNTALTGGLVLGPLGSLAGFDTDLIRNLSKYNEFEKVVGKDKDVDDAIQDYILWKGDTNDTKSPSKHSTDQTPITPNTTSNKSKIKGISDDASRYGIMTEGLSGKDATRYAHLWNKLHSNKRVAGMDIMDLALNVDADDYGQELADDVEELIKLHNKAYHNVYG